MRLAIVGSREISDKAVLMKALEMVKDLHAVDVIVSGGAIGVDTLAREYAAERGLQLMEFLPEYQKYGRGAPLIRNTDIVGYADWVLAIPVKGGSPGTCDSIRKAQAMGKKLYVFEVEK